MNKKNIQFSLLLGERRHKNRRPLLRKHVLEIIPHNSHNS
jgi:hypothetical protein